MLDSTQDSIVNLNNVNVLRGSSFRRFCGFSSVRLRNKTKASIEQSSAMNPAKASKGQRAGFTMIELIFSIVIVGLVILSIPLIVRQSNLNTIMSQNVIGYYNALTLMETIKSKPWDTNNVSDFENSGEYYILNTGDSNQCATIPITMNIIEREYDEATQSYKEVKVQKSITEQTRSKKGLSLANKRRMCDPDSKTASANTSSGDLKSINHFNNYEALVYSDTAEKTEIFKLQVTVDYVPVDFGSGVNDSKVIGKIGEPTNTTTDVKRIQIKLIRRIKDGNSVVDVVDKNNESGEAVFTYYAANIGNDIPLVKDNVANPDVNP